jgi:deoxycytidylate deaminase
VPVKIALFAFQLFSPYIYNHYHTFSINNTALSFIHVASVFIHALFSSIIAASNRIHADFNSIVAIITKGKSMDDNYYYV